MFQITINEKGGQPRQESFEKAEITIGRVQGNDVILPKGNISKRHSRIVLKDGKFIIVDLKSTNGTYVNGKKITAPQVVKSTDKIYIGDFTIQLMTNGGGASAVSEPLIDAAPRGRSQKDDGIDLFGGEAAVELDAPAGRGAGSPGLIDDNFDQEFDAPPPEPASRLPKPSKRSAPPRPVEPEPEPEPEMLAEPELDLDEDFGEPELDVGLEPELPESEPELGFDIENDPEPEPEPKPPVVSAKSKRASTRAAPSRIRPIPSRARPEVRDTELPSHDDGFGLDGATSDELDHHVDALGAATAVPAAHYMVQSAPAAPAVEPLERAEAVRRLHLTVVEELGLRGRDVAELPSLRDAALASATRAAQRMSSAGLLAKGDGVDDVAEEVASLATDLEPIFDLITDDSVVEIAVTHDGQIMADRDGRLDPVDRSAGDERAVTAMIRRLGVLGGANPSSAEPLVDVRLRDGSRVMAALPPLAFRGPTLSFRKTTRDFFTLEKLLKYSTISAAMMTFIDYCVRFRRNIMLSVGPGVSATATLNALVAQMPTDDRIVTIENGVEIHLGGHRNVTALEPHRGVSVVDLIRHAVAMQAERAVVGSLAGPAAPAVLRAIAGPLEGSVVGYSASSPREAFDRLVKVELAEAFPHSMEDAKRLVASAIPIILQEKRFLDNSRRITAIAEVFVEDNEVRVEEVFTFKPEGVDENLIVTGTFAPTGHTPRFLEELVDRGEAEVDMEIFKA